MPKWTLMQKNLFLALIALTIPNSLNAGSLEDAAKYKAEAKMHRDSIKELGESIDAELAPNLIEFENKTIELSGNARQQFIEWRKFLKKMYELEKTPDVQL